MRANGGKPLTDYSFYHLQRQPLEAALPKLLERVQTLNKLLWTYDPDGFLPHGAKADGNQDAQPIYLTADLENPNDASVLVLVDGADGADADGYDRYLYMFDGNDPEALEAARARWKQCRDAGTPATYWQQSPEGRWQEQAASGSATNPASGSREETP